MTPSLFAGAPLFKDVELKNYETLSNLKGRTADMAARRFGIQQDNALANRAKVERVYEVLMRRLQEHKQRREMERQQREANKGFLGMGGGGALGTGIGMLAAAPFTGGMSAMGAMGAMGMGGMAGGALGSGIGAAASPTPQSIGAFSNSMSNMPSSMMNSYMMMNPTAYGQWLKQTQTGRGPYTVGGG